MVSPAQGKLLCDRFVGRIGSREAATICDRQSPPNQRNLKTNRGNHLDQGINTHTSSIHSKFQASEHEGAIGRVRMKSLGQNGCGPRSRAQVLRVSLLYPIARTKKDASRTFISLMQSQCSQESRYVSQCCIEHAVWKKFTAIEPQYPGFFESHWNLMQWNLGADILTSGTATHT